MTTIAAARSDRDLATVRELFQEYADSLDFDLEFQDFQRELDDLPGEYAEPRGCLFLGFENGNAAGCVALREFGDDVAELKRLYVRPQFRSSGLGRLLTQRMRRPQVLALISNGVPSAMISPRLITVTRSASASASSR